MSQQPQQAVARGRGRARGRTMPRPEEGADAAAALPPPGLAPPPQAPLQVAPQAPPQAQRQAPRQAPLHQVPGAEAAAGGAEGGGDPVADVARQMQRARIGGERGGLPRKLLRYQIANVGPRNVVVTRGDAGTPVTLLTNYIRLLVDDNWSAYQMAVEFHPFLNSKPARQHILETSGRLPPNFVYDGGCLYTNLPLMTPEGVRFEAQGRNGWQGEVTIRQVGQVVRNSPQYMHLTNVLMNSSQGHMGMVEVQRSFYYRQRSVRLDNYKLEIWPGFSLAIAATSGPLMLHMDVSHKIIHTESVLDRMYQIYEECRHNHGQFVQVVTETLVGQIIMTTYNCRTYRIDGIEWEAPSGPKGSLVREEMFVRHKPGRPDETISIFDYFQRDHGLTLSDLDQPLLISRPRRRDLPPRRGQQGREVAENVKLPPELCRMTGLTESMRRDFTMMRDLATHTKLDPRARSERLLGFAGEINRNERACNVLAEFGIRIAEQLVSVPGRRLPPEVVSMHQPVQYNTDKADWDQCLKTARMHYPMPCTNWVCIYTDREQQMATDVVNALNQVGRTLGIQFGQPGMIGIAQDRDQSWVQAIQANMAKNTDLVFCLLPNNRAQRYNAIKRICYVTNPVPSQCLLSRTMRNPAKRMAVATKVALQISCKLGGIAWGVTIPVKLCMVVGMDTYHDKRQSLSVQGIVFSLDPMVTQYYSYAPRVHGGRAELHDRLALGFRTALQKFRERNNNELPARIILYRDGVGDSMLEEVKNTELSQVMDCLRDVYGSAGKQPPGFKAIIVKKRISTRLFQPQQPQQLRNPLPGTVVDSTVTMPDYYDFFLVSQHVNQGTVTPTHYNVVLDENEPVLNADRIQGFTYKLTHLYFNWPGTIRVPAPCQYAHRLAYLVGESLGEEPSPQICDRLFFL